MTAAEALYDRLRKGGAVLTPEGGELVVEGPEELLSAEAIAELRSHKAELIELARRGECQQVGRSPGTELTVARRRPGGPPASWGLTRSLRVVELAGRKPGDERRDPLTHVAGEGWPQWQPVEATPEASGEAIPIDNSGRSRLGGGSR